jgi:hypothetical protein
VFKYDLDLVDNTVLAFRQLFTGKFVLQQPR